MGASGKWLVETSADTQGIAALWNEIASYVTDQGNWMFLGGIVLKVVIIFIANRLIIRFAKRSISRMIENRDKNPGKFDIRRTKTIAKMVGSLTVYSVNFITILLILAQFGFNLIPLLAGAGVVGLAVGFGAQSAVKDIISGFFIIFEDQFSVGDVIQTGDYKGTVQEIGLRSTRIRNWTGEVHIIPNGSIADVTNFSIYNSILVVDVSVAYEADLEKATEILGETAKRVFDSSDNIVGEPQVLGVQTMGASEIVLRVTGECLPNTQFGTARTLKAEIKKEFDLYEIDIAYPRLVTYQRMERVE